MNIPIYPQQHYPEWRNWGDFLGTGYIANQLRKYLSYTESLRYVQTLKLKSKEEWREYCRSGKKPDNIPIKPERTYTKEWNGFGEWLGTKKIANQKKQYRPFEAAKTFASNLQLKSTKEWFVFCKSKEKPDDIPTNAAQTYKEQFKGWGDFLGNGNIAPGDYQWRPYAEAKNFVNNLGLNSKGEYSKWCQSNGHPSDIPSNPQMVYSEWEGWGIYLGTNRIRRNSPEQWVPIAKKLSQQHGGLPCASWLIENGYYQLYHIRRKYPQLFAGI